MYSQKVWSKGEILDVLLPWVSLTFPGGAPPTWSRKGKVRDTPAGLVLGDADGPLPAKGHPQAALMGGESRTALLNPKVGCECPGLRRYRDRNLRNT